MLISDQCTERRLSPKFPIAKSHWTGCEFTYRLKLAGQQHLLLFETNLPKPFVLLTDAFMFLLLLLNKSLTKKQTSILPYSAKIFILPFSSWIFLNFFSHLSLKPKILFVFFFSFFPPFALLCFPYLVSLSSFYCFCFPSVQSFFNAYPHDQFPFFPSAQALSYASSTGLIGSPRKKLP